VMPNMGQHVAAARAFLGTRLAQAPGFFGVDAATAANHLSRGERFLPFDAPEPTFYRADDWQIRFAEVPFVESPLGVTVAFSKQAPSDAWTLGHPG